MTKFKQNKNILAQPLQDHIVMLNIDSGKYFSLNQVATAIWDLLEEPRSIDEICEKLVLEFEVNTENCVKEIEDYLKKMEKLKLVEIF